MDLSSLNLENLGDIMSSLSEDDMEKLNIIGPYEGAKPRQVLMTMAEYQEMMVRRED